LANTSAKNPSTGSGIDKPPTSNETEQQSARLEKVIIGNEKNLITLKSGIVTHAVVYTLSQKTSMGGYDGAVVS
jgi:hypothetical protein